jgi:hypothetical protein
MWRERALKIMLVLVGLLFTAMIYPLVLFVKQEPALAMMMSLSQTPGAVWTVVYIGKRFAAGVGPVPSPAWWLSCRDLLLKIENDSGQQRGDLGTHIDRS